MKNKPRPCPFCGCKMLISDVPSGWYISGWHDGDCALHNVKLGPYRTKDEVVIKWNRRHEIRHETDPAQK